MARNPTICILWGGTGLAKVVRPILDDQGIKVVGVFDNGSGIQPPFPDVPLLGGLDTFLSRRAEFEGVGYSICIGGFRGRDRLEIAGTLNAAGLVAINAIHPRSFVAASAHIGAGCQVLAMAAISEFVTLEEFSIVNVGVTIDHECKIGRGTHIMPGATLAGLVEVGDFASIGTNATILPRIKIGKGAVVGAGAVVTKDVAEGVTVVGCPAAPLKRP